jgi:uncharacterized protein (TIGR02271 family)
MSEYSTVAAYFPSDASAEAAMSALRAAGFRESQIGVAAASGPTVGATDNSNAYSAGQRAGNAWEKVKSFFSGNSAEPYAGESSRESSNDNVIAPDYVDPEDLHGSLTGLSVPEHHTRYFGSRLGSSGEGVLVTVNAMDREAEVTKILSENGGDVGPDTKEFNFLPASQDAASVHKIQLLGEVLRVHKDRVSRGEVRLRKEVITSTQTVEVPVTREELVVERVPVTGEQAVSTSAVFQGQEIRIPLSEERASVSKEPVVREEVRIGKKEVSSVEAFDERVRHEELDVDQNTKDLSRRNA